MRTEPLAAHDPRTVGPWQLEGRIGSGGMGVVYLGSRTAHGRRQDAAVKVIPEYLLGRDTALARFRREIGVLIGLDDPGVARVVAADLDVEPPWFAADLVDGPTLAHHVQTQGPLSPELWRSLALALTTTLTRLHARGVIHRDLKPHNIVLGPAGPVIIDFGISAVVGSTSLTSTGDSPRTELWASPEQLRNEESTTSTDIFATGTLLAWAASGTHPFAPRGPYHREGLIAAILTAPPDLTGLPPETRTWIEPLLAKAPAARPTAVQVVEAVTDVDPGRAMALAQAAMQQGWNATARGWLQVAADAGQPEAFVALGDLAADDSDTDGARSWWRLAEAAGHPEAAGRLSRPLRRSAEAHATAPPDPPDAGPSNASYGIPSATGPTIGSGAPTGAQGGRPRPAPSQPTAGRRRPALLGGIVGLAALGVLALLVPRLMNRVQPEQHPGQAPLTQSTRPLALPLTGREPDAQAVRIAVGATSACLITADHLARCWGSNSSGQLGSPGGDARAPRPVSMTGVLRGARLARIAVGASHACALDTIGRAVCWGSNWHGQLGVDADLIASSAQPVVVGEGGALTGRRLTLIGATGNTSCALDTTGTLYCWGDNSTGQLGNGSTQPSDEPVRVNTEGALGGARVRRFGVGGDHTCAVDEDGALFCWGANDHGQLGTGTLGASLVPRRVRPPAPPTDPVYESVNLGGQTSCARARSGEALCWGDNEHGQLGTGPGSPDALVPVLVASPTLALPLDRIAVSGPTVCSTSTRGRVYCWGDNAFGQLGTGTTVSSSLPLQVVDPVGGPLPRLRIVAAGPSTTCGLADDGRAWCWGSNAHGMLGIGAG